MSRLSIDQAGVVGRSPIRQQEQRWRLLIVDDEPSMSWFLADIASQEGYATDIAEDGEEGVKKIDHGGYDAILTDLRMPGRNGLDLIRYTRERYPELPLVMITGYATVANTVEAFHLGVFDLLEKPFDLTLGRALLQRLRQTLERQESGHQQRRQLLLDTTEEVAPVAQSSGMRQALCQAEVAASGCEQVVIVGESGSGRRRLARWIHHNDPRQSLLLGLIAGVDPVDLQRWGVVQPGESVDLLLEGVERLELADWVPLLRRQRQSGGRLLATALQPPGRSLAPELLRHFDLVISIPPLRRRDADLPELLQQVVEQEGGRWGGDLEPQQLLAILRRAVTAGAVASVAELRQWVITKLLAFHSGEAGALEWGAEEGSEEDGIALPTDATLADVERFWIERTLNRFHGNRTQTARALGINPSTLFRRLRQ